jgi:AcrR family transcriptional regulator
MQRLSRIEQVERNRALVLDAARRVFLARGYHGATLEQIAEEAGFSKGVVYSQFESKADLFLALLESRISERAAENARVAGSLREGDLLTLIDHLTRGDQATPGWLLLVIEFRVHAARDAALSRRYAEAHARTVEALADVLATVGTRDGQELAVAPRRLAELMLAFSAGATLEQAADPAALGGRQVAAHVAQVLGPLFRRPAPAPVTGHPTS